MLSFFSMHVAILLQTGYEQAMGLTLIGSTETVQLTEALRHEIDRLLAENGVVLFMKGTPERPRCGFSARVVEILARHGVTYHTVDVLERPDIREGIKIYGNWPTLPQLYVGGALVGGCDIVTQLYQEGTLAETLRPQAPARVQQLSVRELKQWLAAGEAFRLFDVRTADERRIAHIDGSTLLDERARAALEALPRDTRLVFHCHHGGRSQAAAELYLQKGFTKVWNVKGGIDAWSMEVDPAVKRY